MAHVPVLSARDGTSPLNEQWPTLSDARSLATPGNAKSHPTGLWQGPSRPTGATAHPASRSPVSHPHPIAKGVRNQVSRPPSNWVSHAPVARNGSVYDGFGHTLGPASIVQPYSWHDPRQQQHQHPQHGGVQGHRPTTQVPTDFNTYGQAQFSVRPGVWNHSAPPPAPLSNRSIVPVHNGGLAGKNSTAHERPRNTLAPAGFTIGGSPGSPKVESPPTGYLDAEPVSSPNPVGADMPLDRYAKTFVPQWLKAVNDDTNYQFIPLTGSGQSGQIDFAAYAQTVWPFKLWEKLQSGAVDEAFGEDRQLSETAGAWLGEGIDGQGELLESEGEDDIGSPAHHGKSDAPSISSGTNTTLPSQYERLQSEARTSPTTAPSSAGGAKASRTLLRLKPSTYLQHWESLLQAESMTREKELSSHTVFAENLSIYSRSSATGWDPDGLYKVRLPGIREEKPKLTPGNMCHLRVLATGDDGRAYEHFGWLHIVFEARIVTVRALQGEVIVSCPRLQLLAATFPGVQAAKFNVVFVFDSSLLQDEAASVAILARTLKNRSNRAAIALRKWLFPSAATMSTESDSAPTQLNEQQGSPSRSQRWFDDNLNAEQKAAVTSIVGEENRTVPFLLSGPPGTGKTMTSVEAILQILQRSSTNRVLVVAPSNAASDVLATRLSAHLAPGQMYRLNAPTRTFAEIPPKLNAYTYVDEEKREFSLPSWKSLMKAKVVVTACHDVPILINSRAASNIDIGRLQATYLPGLQPDRETSIELHWTHLLVDEAAQGTEPDLAPALACVLPHPRCHSAPAIILVGDPAQLGPAIKNDMCRSQGLDVSLFERLSRLPLYAQSLARLKRHGRSIVLSGGGNTGQSATPHPEFSAHSGHLIRNYRARHPALLHLPSTLFYSDSLVPCAPANGRLIDLLNHWTQLPRRGALRGMPMLLADIRSHEEWVDEGVSWWNEGEVRKIVELCRSLVGAMGCSTANNNNAQNLNNGQYIVKPSEIAVISPFREQVWRLRVALRAAGLGDVAVGPVEAYQGQEAPIVILSPVRSRSRFLASDREAGQGLVCEAKRLNVALTRARELLIVVGNAELLGTHCESWRRVVGHARRNGWLIDAKKTRDSVASTQKVTAAGESEAAQEDISALESAEASVSASWWRRMAGSLLDDAGDVTGFNQDRHDRVDVDESGDGLSLLAGRMATVALQADEDDVGDEEDDSHDDTTPVQW